MSDNEKSNLPTTYSADNITINFSEPIKEIEKVGKKSRELIKAQGVYTPDARVWINKKTLPHLLATDNKATNRMFNNLEDKDKLENGKEKYASVESIQKEISKKIQEPRDTIQKERLKDTEEILKNFRDSPDLEKKRELEESKIRKELPDVKRKKLKAARVDELTGEPLTNPEVHHKDRVADNPRRALDETNLATINKKTHKKVHQLNIETEKDFEKAKANKTLERNSLP